MTKRSTSLRFPEGTTKAGTAHVRSGARPAMTTAQRLIFESTGNRPRVDSGFDEIADGFYPGVDVAPSVSKPKKQPKYRNVRCEYDGIKFDSRRERDRWVELMRQRNAGEISNLERQVVFVLADPVVIDGRKRPALRYIADFVYERDGATVIEDVKGRITEGYRIKRHLMASRGLMITEIK
ncbi:hypothetical protein BGV71_14245 [Burkholderia ubonensis]|uniref:DUF1064 domain-containing protein n=1 Tax=Burkholderia ubonensis TaxID=101571 RepID=UPI0008FE4FAF|nr:DUF1064 domain-containing protein [Burkholderia ubonensis]OJA82927.1 hypothetical protein BGV71_14245 [Burkholderia ubonensis]